MNIFIKSVLIKAATPFSPLLKKFPNIIWKIRYCKDYKKFPNLKEATVIYGKNSMAITLF